MVSKGWTCFSSYQLYLHVLSLVSANPSVQSSSLSSLLQKTLFLFTAIFFQCTKSLVMQLGRVLLENNEKVVQDIFFLLIVSLLGLSGTLAFAVAWKKFLITFESLKREINGRRGGGRKRKRGKR